MDQAMECRACKELGEACAGCAANRLRQENATLQAELTEAKGYWTDAQRDARVMADWLDCYPGVLPKHVEEAISRNRD